MIVDLVEIIRILIIFQTFIFSAFLFFRKINNTAGILLGCYFYAQSMGVFSQLLDNKYLFENYTHLSYIGYPFIFLWGPTFYFYVKAFTFSDFRFKYKYLLHAVPFITAAAYLLTEYYFHSAETKQRLASSLFMARNASLISAFLNVQILVYSAASLWVLKKYSDRLKQNFSAVEKINLNWLKFFVIYYVLAHFVSVIISFNPVVQLFSLKTLILSDYLIFLIFFNVVFFKSWGRQDIFTGAEEPAKYKSSNLTRSEAEKWIRKLNHHIEIHKPYMNPELTIHQLAEEIRITPRILSQILNEYFNQNFYDYIGSLRIEEAKKILDEKGSETTILEVIYKTGYNSKSAFNKAFKKNTGMTPSEFRKKTMRP